MTTSHHNEVATYFRIKPDEMPRLHEPNCTPTYSTMEKFQEAIDDCALTIPSWAPILGHLALVIARAEYEEANDGNPWTPPVNPGEAPTAPPTIATPDANNPAEVAAHAAAALLSQAPDHFAIQESLRLFTQRQKAYDTYKNANKALHNLIINAGDDQYINDLKHIRTGYVNVTPIALLDHLWKKYGTIDDTDLTANEARMKTPWNPPAPIEDLFKQLKVGQEFAIKGKEEIPDAIMLRYGYNNIKQTGLFTSYNTKWRDKDEGDKTWENLKTHYAAAHNDLKKNTTVEATGYSASAIQELVRNEIGALFNVDQAPPLEPEPEYYQPESANAAVTLEQLKNLITTLVKPQEKKKKLKGQAKNEEGQWITYCHTHGVTTNLSHTSSNCSRKKEVMSTGIEWDASYQCHSLVRYIRLSRNLEFIGYQAFLDCKSHTLVIWPSFTASYH